MSNIFGIPYTPPTPDEIEALMRKAHRERAQAMREAWRALFRWRRETQAAPSASCVSLRPSL